MDALQPRPGTDDPCARYQEISPREGRGDRTATRAVDRRTGAAVVVHRHAGAGQTSADTARRAARLDHPVLAPVLDVWVDDGDAVAVHADVAGLRLSDGGAARSAADVLTDVLAPLAEGLDALHSSGLAHGAVGADTVVMARFGGDLERPVLLGSPSAAADPSGDRRDLAALALLLCERAAEGRSPSPGEDGLSRGLRHALTEAAACNGREHRSCVALVDHLRRAASGPAVTPQAARPPTRRLNSLWRQSPRIVQTGILVGAVALGAVRLLGRDGGAPVERPDGRAWLVTTGGVAGGDAPPAPIVAGAATPSSEGLWLVAADGSVVVTGDAPPVEAVPGGAPVVAAISRPDAGLWLVTADGVTHSRAGAPVLPPAQGLVTSVIDATAIAGADGLWLLGADGSVTGVGGVAGAPPLTADPNAAAIAAHPSGAGGWRVSASGAISEFGGAPTLAPPSSLPAGTRVVRVRPTPTGTGLWLLLSNGAVFTAGDAAPLAVPAAGAPAVDLVVGP